MGEKHATIAIVSPGARQESLRAFLSAIEQIDLLGMASGALTGWKMVRELAPVLVVIEGSLPDEEVILLLNYLNNGQKQISSLVLANSRRQEQAAIAVGASAVLTGQGTLDKFGLVVGELLANTNTADS